MKAIRRLLNFYVVFFVVIFFLTLWFAVKSMSEATFIFGTGSIALLMLLVRQYYLFYHASLILDNCILTMPLAVIFTAKGKMETVETIVSTFGILMDSKVYKWACDGVHGVWLKSIEIDRTRVYLAFGDETKTVRVELLHGMAHKQEVMDVKEKLWRETGVISVVSGW